MENLKTCLKFQQMQARLEKERKIFQENSSASPSWIIFVASQSILVLAPDKESLATTADFPPVSATQAML